MLVPFHFVRFKSSVINGGSLLHPESIEIDESFVTLRKKKGPFSGIKSVSIPILNIVNVEVSSKATGADILIESLAKRQIEGRGFSSSSARKIERLLREHAPRCR
jgi:hypothetical protein